MNYTEIVNSIPYTVEYGVHITWTGIQWLFQLIVILIIASLRSESPHMIVNAVILIIMLLNYSVEYSRNISLWGWQHLRRVLRYTNEVVDEESDDTYTEEDDWTLRLTLPPHFTKEYAELRIDADRDMDCNICYMTMNVDTVRILRSCCHICCISCIRKLRELKCPYCKMHL